MTARDDVTGILSAWLDEQAGHRTPDYLHETLARTVRTRQRPAWSSLERWLPMDLALRAGATAPVRLGRLLIVAAVILALIAIAVAAAGSRGPRVPAPFGLAANGSISSWSNGDIFVSDADGGNLRPLIAGTTNDVGPLHTRDGTRLAFWRLLDAHTTQVMMANADGSGIRPLTDSPLTDADWYEFSAGDDQLAIVHGVGAKRVLSILDVVHGGALRDLPILKLSVDNDVLWRPPTGAELIFTARAIPGSAAGATVYAVHPDGTGLRPITSPSSVDWGYQGIEISPDGRQLAYWQYEPDTSADGVSAYIHLLDLDSGADRRVRFDPAAQDEAELHFSPDGRTAVIVRQTDLVHIVIVPVDGSNPGRVVGPPIPGDQNGRAIGFSPDGRQVVLHLDGEKPQFIDVASGNATVGPSTFGTIASWQRLAP